MRWPPLLILFACACGNAQEPPPSSPPAAETVAVAPASAPPAASALAPSSASAPPPSSQPPPAPTPTLDAATCAKNAPPASKCKWTVAAKVRCSGAALPPGPPAAPSEWVCVCNGCETDADCTTKTGGRCQSFNRVCASTASACVYPGDLCAANGGCEKKHFPRGGSATIMDPGQCTHDGAGHAVCGAMQQPPPSRPPPRVQDPAGH